MMKTPLPELHASWVPELPPPVGMAYPFTQEKKSTALHRINAHSLVIFDGCRN